MNRTEYVAAVAPAAVKVRVDGGVLFPNVSIAQTLLEKGWQDHVKHPLRRVEVMERIAELERRMEANNSFRF